MRKSVINTDSSVHISVFICLLNTKGVFEHVTDSTKQFKDDYLFFRFTNKPKVVIIGAGFAGSKYVHHYLLLYLINRNIPTPD